MQVNSIADSLFKDFIEVFMIEEKSKKIEGLIKMKEKIKNLNSFPKSEKDEQLSCYLDSFSSLIDFGDRNLLIRHIEKELAELQR